MNVFKKIVIGAALVSGGAYLYVKSKTKDIKNIVDNLSFKIDRIRNVDFNIGNITLTVDVLLNNNSNESFTVDTGNLINFRKVTFLTQQGRILGQAEKYIDNVSLYANNATIIESVEVVINTDDLGGILSEFISGLKPKDIAVKAHIEILGKQYIV